MRVSLALLALSGACGDHGPASADAAANLDGSSTDGNSLADAGAPPDALVATCAPASGQALALEEIASGLRAPVFVTSPAGDARLFVVEQPGTIRVIEDGVLVSEPYLDVSDNLTYGGEQGLLGLAFHPDFGRDGRLYVYYTAKNGGANTVVEYRQAGHANQVLPGSGRIVLSIADFAANHNGGMMAFGPDGYLYIGTGDGGGGGDPNENGQDKTELLAKMLRLDVDGEEPYAIPPDNPFATDPGAGVRGEIWHYGLRNPWRWSFDRRTGDQWIGDVGQGRWEEIDRAPAGSAGLDFGWDEKEGVECYSESPACDLAGHRDPVYTYDHPNPAAQRAVVGGYVYRGSCLPDIDGWYFFADYSTNQIFVLDTNQAPLPEPVQISPLPGGTVAGLASFGEDALGELYVVSHGGKLFKIVHSP